MEASSPLFLTVTMWRWHEWTLKSTSGTFVLCRGRSQRCLYIGTECVLLPGLLFFVISTLSPVCGGYISGIRKLTCVTLMSGSGLLICSRDLYQLFVLQKQSIHQLMYTSRNPGAIVGINVTLGITMAGQQQPVSLLTHRKKNTWQCQWVLPSSSSFLFKHHAAEFRSVTPAALPPPPHLPFFNPL